MALLSDYVGKLFMVGYSATINLLQEGGERPLCPLTNTC